LLCVDGKPSTPAPFQGAERVCTAPPVVVRADARTTGYVPRRLRRGNDEPDACGAEPNDPGKSVAPPDSGFRRNDGLTGTARNPNAPEDPTPPGFRHSLRGPLRAGAGMTSQRQRRARQRPGEPVAPPGFRRSREPKSRPYGGETSTRRRPADPTPQALRNVAGGSHVNAYHRTENRRRRAKLSRRQCGASPRKPKSRPYGGETSTRRRPADPSARGAQERSRWFARQRVPPGQPPQHDPRTLKGCRRHQR
jgi:hypothetical protein